MKTSGVPNAGQARNFSLIFGVVFSFAVLAFAPWATSGQAARTIRAANAAAQPGKQVTVSFLLDSLGDESSASFTVNFNPAILSNPVAALGSGAPAGSYLGTNVNEVAAGKIGILVDSTNKYATGSRQFMTITFNVAAGAQSGSTPVTFASEPTRQSVSSDMGVLLPTTYSAGNVQIGSSAAGTGTHVSGRVLSPDGRGIRGSVVTITGPNGARRTATTTSFGVYRFADVATGASYIISVSAKRYRFAPRTVQVADSLNDLDFVGQQ